MCKNTARLSNKNVFSFFGMHYSQRARIYHSRTNRADGVKNKTKLKMSGKISTKIQHPKNKKEARRFRRYILLFEQNKVCLDEPLQEFQNRCVV